MESSSVKKQQARVFRVTRRAVRTVLPTAHLSDTVGTSGWMLSRSLTLLVTATFPLQSDMCILKTVNAAMQRVASEQFGPLSRPPLHPSTTSQRRAQSLERI